MTAGDRHYEEARRLRDLITSSASNERPIMAWAAVCRECAKASNAKRNELAADGRIAYTRSECNWFSNLDRIWWYAQAQVETRAVKAA